MSLTVRAMLEDRFQLKIHREKRDLPVYNLVVAKDGSRLKSVDAPAPFNPANAPPILPGRPVTPPPGMIFRGFNNVIGSAIQSEQLASVLSSLVGRLVIDKTDLKGYFDLKLEFAPQGFQGNPVPTGGPPNAAAEPQGPSIFTAVQEQLGLRLEASRSSVEVIIIDSIQKPSEN
jgi:bla regulator protein blaR1